MPIPAARPEFKVHVSVVLLSPNGRVLLVQEGKPECRGQWNLPGGHLDHGETPATGAARELREETGVEVPVSELLGVYPRSKSIRFVYLAHALDEAAQAGDEIMAVRWLDPAEITATPDGQLTAPVNLKQLMEDLRSGRVFDPSVIRPPTP